MRFSSLSHREVAPRHTLRVSGSDFPYGKIGYIGEGPGVDHCIGKNWSKRGKMHHIRQIGVKKSFYDKIRALSRKKIFSKFWPIFGLTTIWPHDLHIPQKFENFSRAKNVFLGNKSTNIGLKTPKLALPIFEHIGSIGIYHMTFLSAKPLTCVHR